MVALVTGASRGIGLGIAERLVADGAKVCITARKQEALDEAVTAGTIPPIDTRVTGVVWFGALDEVVARWLQAERPGGLEETYPTLRALLLRSVGVSEDTIAAGPHAALLAAFPEVRQ